ncbi:hypothetical protein [Paenibacillus amylolyticus]|uniref:hypothetical protein n=1 Tax=Paenibacillus amylolyticus TaxID=1451 RepID=UPI0013E3A0DA|nr:hypothetical protein [Paenibacillus amylolyticus]
MNQADKENVEEIRELLAACLEEEGYRIPQSRFANDNLSGFKIVLRSGTEVEILMHF